MAEVYEKLAMFLDRLPAGFPRTESGVELRILRKLFTPQEAELALHLSLVEEEARVVAYRAHQPVEKVASMLDEMERKGLVMGSHKPGQPLRYAVSQYIVGIWEGQVNRLDPELVKLEEEYLPYLFTKDNPWNKLPQIRTIPVGESIPITTEVMHYERAEEIIRANTEFAVSNCICRQEMQIRGEGCEKPMETCMSFGETALGLVYNGRSRKISMDEALGILKQAEEVGLVLQPANSQAPIFICACCGCCCGVLRYLKQQEKPADLVANPFIAQHNPDTCSDCGTCTERCQMDAMTMIDGIATLNQERCIGCGLCVTTCPTGSMTLVRKPVADQPAIPKDTTDTYLRLGQVRDKLNIVKMAGVLVKSKVDRLITPQ